MQLQKTMGNQAAAQLLKSREQPDQPIQKKNNRTGMPDPLKSGLENISGMDLSDVRVHYNSDKPAQLQALAYAQGNEIHVGPQQEKHLPHEGWHVVQQRQGRVQPTIQANGAAINDDRSLENEADVMGARAMQHSGQPVQRQLKDDRSGSSTSIQRAVVQRVAIGTLGLLTVNDTKYVNNNEATLLQHMGGEWNGNNGTAATGGHLLSKMESKWGAAQYQQPHNAASVTADAVYFTNGTNLPSKITNVQHEYFLGKVGPPTKHSNTKSSTFWPKDWSDTSFKAMLNDSHTTNTANTFASKANTNYWYTWQMLGGNTAFPLNRYSNLN